MNAIANVLVQTNNELIKISTTQINWENVESVNARDLHIKLWVWKVFANWIKDRIEKYGFIENIDFAKIGKPQQNNKTDYMLTLDTAKEIAMVENNENGRQIRRYFIEIEKLIKKNTEKKEYSIWEAINLILKRLKSAEQESKLLKELFEASETLNQINERQEKELKELKLILENKKNIQTNIATIWIAEIYISIEELAKNLWMTRPALFKELRYRKYLKLDNTPYKYYLNKLFKVVDTKYLRWEQNYNYKQTMVTREWIDFFSNLFKKSFV